MTAIDATLMAGVFGVFMALIELAKMLARRGDARKVSITPDACAPCRETVARTADTTSRVLAAVEENTAAQRELTGTIREWIAEQRGRAAVRGASHGAL